MLVFFVYLHWPNVAFINTSNEFLRVYYLWLTNWYSILLTWSFCEKNNNYELLFIVVQGNLKHIRKYIRCDFFKQAKWKLNFGRVDALVVESLHTWLILIIYTNNIHNILNSYQTNIGYALIWVFTYLYYQY